MKKLLSFLFFLAVAPQAFALTRLEIRNQVRRNINDVPGVAAQFRHGNETLNELIDDVQREVNAMTWAVEASSSITLVAGTTYYTMPTNMIVPMRVQFSDARGVRTTLNEDSEHSITENTPDFERNSVGIPTRYFMRQSKAGGTELQMGILPIPNAQSTGTLRIDYAVQLNDMDEDSDIPFNGLSHLEPYHYTIIWGVSLRIKAMEGDAGGVQNFSGLYDRSLKIMRDNLGKMPNFLPSASPGGSR